MDKDEVVVEVGAEGGSISLIGTRRDCGWAFSWATSESIDEDSFFEESAEVGSWEGALRLLDKYPWQTFHPSTVHPEFRDRGLDRYTGAARWRLRKSV
jgi:hypothetical protein